MEVFSEGACKDLEKLLFLISQIAAYALGWLCHTCSICLGDMEKWKGQNYFPSSRKCLKMTSCVGPVTDSFPSASFHPAQGL